MQFMLVLYEDPELIATEEQRKEAVQRVGDYAMSLVGDGTLKGGAPLRPVTEAKQVRTRDGQTRILDGPFAGYFVIEASAGLGYPLSGRPGQSGVRRAHRKPHNSPTRRPIPTGIPTDETTRSGALGGGRRRDRRARWDDPRRHGRATTLRTG